MDRTLSRLSKPSVEELVDREKPAVFTTQIKDGSLRLKIKRLPISSGDDHGQEEKTQQPRLSPMKTVPKAKVKKKATAAAAAVDDAASENNNNHSKSSSENSSPARQDKAKRNHLSQEPSDKQPQDKVAQRRLDDLATKTGKPTIIYNCHYEPCGKPCTDPSIESGRYCSHDCLVHDCKALFAKTFNKILCNGQFVTSSSSTSLNSK